MLFLFRNSTAARMMSLASVDLPEPETPVSAVKAPIGRLTVMFLRLCARAPVTVRKPENASGSFLGSSGMVERLPLR